MADSPIELNETVQFETPHGHKIEIRGYSTGRVRQAISAAYLSTMKIESTGETDKSGKAITRTLSDASSANVAINAALELMVLNLDGQSDDIVNRVLDLPEEDYDAIRREVDKVTSPLAQKPATS